MNNDIKLTTKKIKIIEFNLYTFLQDKKELAEEEEDIYTGSTNGSEKVQSAISDPTQNRAINLVTNRRLLRLRQKVKDTEEAINYIRMLPEKNMFRLMELKYFQNKLTDQGIIQELCISKRTYYRWKREILKIVGRYTGIL